MYGTYDPEYGFIFIPLALAAAGGGLKWAYDEAKDRADQNLLDSVSIGGGSCTMPGSGEIVTCDEMKSRLCVAGQGFADWCDSSSANQAAVDSAGLPATTWEAVKQTLDPTTVIEHPEYLLPEHLEELKRKQRKIPTWALWAGAATLASVGAWMLLKEGK